MSVGFVFLEEPKPYRSTYEPVFFSQILLHVALIAPMQKLGVGPVYLEVRWVVVFLDYVIKLGLPVL